MKAKVRLTMSVELIVEGDNEEVITDWLNTTSPSEAIKLSDGNIEDVFYNDKILGFAPANARPGYVIK